MLKQINKTQNNITNSSSNISINNILIDTNILYSYCDQNDIFHEPATQFIELCKKIDYSVMIPGHALFEFNTVRKKRFNKNDINLLVKRELAFRILYIDEAFIDRFYIEDLPLLKGSDYIFLCIAYVEKIPFVTEDNHFHKEEIKKLINVYHINEFINSKNV